jgi:hypothetical protein
LGSTKDIYIIKTIILNSLEIIRGTSLTKISIQQFHYFNLWEVGRDRNKIKGVVWVKEHKLGESEILLSNQKSVGH